MIVGCWRIASPIPLCSLLGSESPANCRQASPTSRRPIQHRRNRRRRRKRNPQPSPTAAGPGRTVMAAPGAGFHHQSTFIRERTLRDILLFSLAFMPTRKGLRRSSGTKINAIGSCWNTPCAGYSRTDRRRPDHGSCRRPRKNAQFGDSGSRVPPTTIRIGPQRRTVRPGRIGETCSLRRHDLDVADCLSHYLPHDAAS